MTNAPEGPQQPVTPGETPDAVVPDAAVPDATASDAVVPDATASGAPRRVVERDEVLVRRAPKVPVFLIVGAALGVVVSLIVTSLFPFDSGEGVAQTYGYISLWGLTIGGAVGSLVAIVAERVTARGARQVQVEREAIEMAEVADEPEQGPEDEASGEPDDGRADRS